jgi:CRISPR-associated protein Cas1
VCEAKALGELLGVEGNGAAIYFDSFGAMLRGGDGDGRELPRFKFENRNRRPATDPVNAMLSLAYAMVSPGFD